MKKNISSNPIIARLGTLILAIREGEEEDLKEAVEQIQEFCDAWLVSGDGADFPGLKNCCLADTDTAGLVKEAIEQRLT